MHPIICRLITLFILNKEKRKEFRKKHEIRKFRKKHKKKKNHFLKKFFWFQELKHDLETIQKIQKFTIDITKLPPATGNLKMVQDCSVAILNYFDKICKKHNIQYWLDSGTLIGHTRHNGFIPWDDDIDICMMRDDYEKLPNILDNEFKKDGFFWRDGEIIQLFFKNCPAQVDIFPMDSGNQIEPPQGEEYNQFLSCLNEIKSHMDFDSTKWKQKQCPVSEEYLTYCFKTRDEKLVPNKIKNGFIFYGVETGVNNRSCFSHSDIFPLEKISFYEIETYKPQNSDYYLFCQYGDFMTLPQNYSSNHGACLANYLDENNYKNCQELIKNYYPKVEKNEN